LTILTKRPIRTPPPESESEKIRNYCTENSIDWSKIEKKVNQFGDVLRIETTNQGLVTFVKTLGLS